jgi:hypothetical protein
MLRQPVCRPRSGLFCQETGKIFHNSRLCVIAIAMTLSTLGTTTALGGYSATRSYATVAALSHAMRAGRPPISSQRTDPPDARPDPSEAGRVVDQLYQKLMRDSAQMLNLHE